MRGSERRGEPPFGIQLPPQIDAGSCGTTKAPFGAFVSVGTGAAAVDVEAIAFSGAALATVAGVSLFPSVSLCTLKCRFCMLGQGDRAVGKEARADHGVISRESLAADRAGERPILTVRAEMAFEVIILAVE